ncbi:c-type cytochrome [Sphingosinicella sp.]|uniref:c-type cytochrome n=1 Tax=Sphingosinicella sp. TaxID=1917971 RepID=UPI004037BA91
MSHLRGPVVFGLTLLVAACSGGSSPPAGNVATAGAPEAPPPAANNVDTMTGATLAQFSGDAAAGQRVFLQCQSCHAVEAGANRLGPTLHGVVGRQSGGVPGFNYSPANRNAGIIWTPEKLFQYLENPRRVVPGTTMAFAGIGDPRRRADLIAYLATLHD